MPHILFFLLGFLLFASPVQAKTNPLKGMDFYVDPHSNARLQVLEWKDERPGDADQMRKISREPQGKWLGEWNTEPKREVDAWTDAAREADEFPLFVLYYIPHRDCGSFSSGGAETNDAYREFVDRVAAGVGERRGVVIIEPDALGVVDCLTKKQKARRFSMIAYAVHRFKTRTNMSVYIDAGNSDWVPAEKMARRLNKSGIAEADGFALNVSKFYTTRQTRVYGEEVSPLVGGKHFVIDTSRNGMGPTEDHQWCNPWGRGLGRQPTTDLKHPLTDALLWIKPPGESDGTCNGGPEAGRWWADYALGLAMRSIF